ncbi:hypothetical protein [Desulforamulus ferrireducens]|uniref:Uncharacterized protein n=1 Tax=Desulforamulus ferrireducens TaxID=1833852 RepID=A0A1S6IZR4_9FIRM|nr:hypothetical protein [Desulforamulus ferrireducens]AQS60258.1 hypothetical protein B0537_14950 [Desulforamulus ferrireducens]
MFLLSFTGGIFFCRLICNRRREWPDPRRRNTKRPEFPANFTLAQVVTLINCFWYFYTFGRQKERQTCRALILGAGLTVFEKGTHVW